MKHHDMHGHDANHSPHQVLRSRTSRIYTSHFPHKHTQSVYRRELYFTTLFNQSTTHEYEIASRLLFQLAEQDKLKLCDKQNNFHVIKHLYFTYYPSLMYARIPHFENLYLIENI